MPSFALLRTFLRIDLTRGFASCLPKVCSCRFGRGILLDSGVLSAERVGLKVPFAFLRDLFIAARERRCLGFRSIASNRRLCDLAVSRVERPGLGFCAANGCPTTRRGGRNEFGEGRSPQPSRRRLRYRNRPAIAAVCTCSCTCTCLKKTSKKVRGDVERTEVHADTAAHEQRAAPDAAAVAVVLVCTSGPIKRTGDGAGGEVEADAFSRVSAFGASDASRRGMELPVRARAGSRGR